MTSGRCKSAKDVDINPILEHHNVLCRKLFKDTINNPNHKLHTLLPLVNDHSRYDLRHQRHFNVPRLRTKRASNTFIFSMIKQLGL